LSDAQHTELTNFSVASGDDYLLVVDSVGEVLSGSNILWQLFPQQHGVIMLDTPLISKSLIGGGVEILPSPPESFAVVIGATDTEPLLPGNYYQECRVVGPGGGVATVLRGFVTVTLAEIVVS